MSDWPRSAQNWRDWLLAFIALLALIFGLAERGITVSRGVVMLAALVGVVWLLRLASVSRKKNGG
jgi:hypothetical protein